MSLSLLLLAGCQSKLPSTPTPMEGMVEFRVSSEAFDEGDIIPQKYTCDGADLSPPLSWSHVPKGTQSLVLIVDDPDAPTRTWVHWVLYNIPGSRTSLPEGVRLSQDVSEFGSQGYTDFGRPGYGGPCPPSGGAHRYFFKIYALDQSLNLPQNPTKEDVEQAMEGHILGLGQLMGKYSR
jgi:Raf kinase inhibitor-like YbhB/YbcL family protein